MKAQEQKKPDLKTKGCHGLSVQACRWAPTGLRSIEQSEPIHLAACEAERRNWHEGCLRTGAMIATRRAQEVPARGVLRREAISVTEKQRDCTQRHIVMTLIPRRRVPLAGSVGAKRIKVGGSMSDRTDNVCCVLSRKQSRCPASQRSEKRSIGCSFMPTRRVADGRIYQWRSRASAKPTFLTLRWWSETAGCAMKGQKGNRDRRLCSPTAECQTNQLGLGPPSVRSAIFPNGETERQRNVVVGKWPCSRLMLFLAPGEASRCYCFVLGDRRSLAPYCGALPASNDSWAIACWPICGVSRPLESSGAHDFFPDCLASLRPSECSGVEM